MWDYTEELINEYAESPVVTEQQKEEARKIFNDALKAKFDPATRTVKRTGVIDLDNFHKAHDDEIEELLLYKLFDSEGKLNSRSSYGEIKKLDKTKYPNLVKDLTSLWAAQFVDYLKCESAEEHQQVEQDKTEFTTKLAEAEKECEAIVNDYINELSNESTVKEALSKVEATGEKAAFTHKLTISYPSKYDNDYKGLYTAQKVYFRIDISFADTLVASVGAYAYNGCADFNTALRLVDKSLEDDKNLVINRTINQVDVIVDKHEVNSIVKKLTGKDREFFGSSSTVILKDGSNEYVLKMTSKPYSFGSDKDEIASRTQLIDLKTDTILHMEDLDTIKVFPLEIEAIKFGSYSEHNIHSIASGYHGSSGAICFTTSATDAAYNYFKIEKHGNELVDTVAENPPALSDVSSKFEYNKEINGMQFVVVLYRSVTTYND